LAIEFAIGLGHHFVTIGRGRISYKSLMTTAAQAGAGAWWVPGAHLQTAWARLARSRRLVTFEREVLTTPDDDDLVLDHAAGPPGSPRVLLLHGLEGIAYSRHTQGLARLVARAGWRATVLNFRSCARDPERIERRLRNRRPRLYHSGETGDLDLVVRALVAREPATRLCAIGFSLGGSVLLKWLGEQGARSAVHAAATISAPYDLAAAARFLDRRVGRFYAARFMRRLKDKTLDLMARFPRETAHLDGARIRAARTFGELDRCVTAPLHGFASAVDYYARASALGYLGRIAVPTLCISSADDPFFPAEAAVRARQAASAHVAFDLTAWGGHAGFVSGRWPWRPSYWAEERVIEWLGRPAGRAPVD
jgi:predicted alpha/beta-fold hydrolase